MKYKTTTQLSCLAALLFAAGAIPNLNAFTYTNENAEVLLVFRKATFSDVLFNLGTVSNFLSKANGTTFTVTNFRLSAVTAQYGANLSGVGVSLLAVTTPTDALLRAWVTDPNSTGQRFKITGSRYGQIRSKIDAIGQFPEEATFNSQTNEYITQPSESTSPTYVMSTGGSLDSSTLSGTVPFPIEGAAPVTLRFWELAVGSASAAATQVGSFNITSGGVLAFTKGAEISLPTITQQPANATIFAGGTTNFTVVASGATSYQWQFNNNPIGGATSSSYSLTAHAADAGNYRVIVSSAGGSVTSSVATLTVNLPIAASLGQFSKAPDGPFSLNLSGTAGAYYEIQINTNLSTSNWITIAFITNSGGMTAFSDSAATNSNQRFYRAIAR